MENAGAEDESKPFDAEARGGTPEREPDPNEVMTFPFGAATSTGHWLVKIPRFLMERWLAVPEEGVPLATLRYYAGAVNPVTGRAPRVLLTLPADARDPAAAPDQYELDVVQNEVQNAVVVAEAPKRDAPPGSRARMTTLVGHVAHECSMRPRFDAAYRRRMRERSLKANTPVRQSILLDPGDVGAQGELNRLSSGVANARGFSDLVKQKQKPAKGAFERMARMPKNQLLDALFGLFRERTHWPIRLLRERTQQPEQYLKETLTEIGQLHRSGEHAGTWELKPNFREEVKGEQIGPSTAALYAQPDVKGEYMDEEYGDGEDDDDDDDDDDDEDMEEVA